MMTPEQFHERYYNWQTMWDTDAEAEANRVNAEGIDGDRAIPIQLCRHGMWAIILRSSATFLKRTGEV